MNSIPTPTKFFLAAGASEGHTPLNAFDAALGKAGVADCNLVKLSSILPPKCEQVDSFQPPYGSLTPTAYASMTTSLPGEVIAGAVAVAVPVDDTLPGVIMEYSARGAADNAEAIVRDMAAEAFRIRDRELKEILSISVEHRVENIGAVFAAVIFGYDED
ncbi:arginine decarboxylase, pyruvoyl-dependent [bacterium]|nr:arginine decarboxylase, pyruvoyl-dependent [bacterium]